MKKIIVCERCGENITDVNQAVKFAGKINHFRCPRDAHQEEWDRLMDEMSRGEL